MEPEHLDNAIAASCNRYASTHTHLDSAGCQKVVVIENIRFRGGSVFVIDPTKRIYNETNVDVPGGLKSDAAYDLDLYMQLGSQSRGVLVVTSILNLQFKSGIASKDRPEVNVSKGDKIDWAPTEKLNFMRGVKAAVEDKWSWKHVLTTTSDVPSMKEITVQFVVKVDENMSRLSHSHWNVEAYEVDDFATSFVCGQGGGWFHNGKAPLDSQDLDPVNKGAPEKQRGCVDEFGHMCGLRHEYSAANANSNWITDKSSVMHSGETVNPRHYAFFADWVSVQYADVARLAGSKIEYKVNGTVNGLNGLL